jgi:PAS domain S-box-containing protein
MAFSKRGSGVERVAFERGRAQADSATRERVLVVDDNKDASAGLEMILRAEGFDVSTQPSGEAALMDARRAPPDVVLADLRPPGISALELCQRLHEIDRYLPVIFVTERTDVPSVVEGLRAGAEDYLVKPLERGAVVESVERALARRGVKMEQDSLLRQLNERLVLSSVREQEHAEAEAEQRANLHALLASLNDGVVIAEPGGHVLMINEAGRAMLGLGSDEVSSVDRLLELEAYDLEGRPRATEQRTLARALRGEQFSELEVLRRRRDGERRRLVFTGASLRDEDDNVSLAIVVFRDVTELRLLERQRDEYLALITHDLRNPLNSILLHVSGLKRSLAAKGLDQEVKRAERAAQNVAQMSAMLDELAEVTTIESEGVAILRRAACDLLALVTSVVDSMDESRARRVTIESDDAPYVAFADAARLARVITNLLTNALKYSADDALVNVRLVRKGPDIELDVVDHGIGIAPMDVDHLFDRYFRATTGKALAGGLGLGLGLYITRLIVEAHGGRIQVSSEVGKGSTFRVTLPSYAAA